MLKFISNITWEEIFNVWKSNEGSDSVWQKFASEVKGWPSWDAWRTYQASLMDAEKRSWQLYEITNPNEAIPNFRIGPYKGWQKHFENKNVHTFSDLINNHADWVRANSGIKARRENFPSPTQFIGISLEGTDTIVLFEGHHRAAAVALAVFEKMPIEFKIKPLIALTTFSKQENELFKKMLEIGSENPNRL